jgi:spoIIIJ-associated protein
MSDPEPPDAAHTAGTRVESTGETVGEAKWAALRELEQRFPGLDKGRVRFQVLSEGERGLLGVGFTPARVIAELGDAASARGSRREPPPGEEPGSPEAVLRELLEAVCAGLAVRASVQVSRSHGELRARLAGPDVGLLIGKRGSTIDAIQYLANAAVRGTESERLTVVVDAAGYRDRREATLARVAEDAAREALAAGAPVALEPMSAPERKLVHLALQERTDVTTESEGAEPNRHVVVSPAE